MVFRGSRIFLITGGRPSFRLFPGIRSLAGIQKLSEGMNSKGLQAVIPAHALSVSQVLKHADLTSQYFPSGWSPGPTSSMSVTPVCCAEFREKSS